MVQDSLLLQK